MEYWNRVNRFVRNLLRFVSNADYRSKRNEVRRLKRRPRYSLTSTNLLGPPIILPDSASFLSMYREIFERGIYYFNCISETPFIIDCGANIGLSVIYFKRLYPNAEIIAFEPDANIFSILSQNLASSLCYDVQCINKGVWNVEGEVSFGSEGSDAGRIDDLGIASNSIVRVTKLSQFIDRRVDFLKVDIEGSEYEVLGECSDVLKNVDNIFVEYHSFAGRVSRLSNVTQILEQAGFRLYIESAGVKNNRPFSERRVYHGMDNLLNIFGIRRE